MIDRANGNLIISPLVIIKSGDNEEDIKSYNLGEANYAWEHGNGWSWLSEKNIKIKNAYFIIDFGFFENKLKEISLIFDPVKFDLTKGWESWSEDDEKNSLIKLKSWLVTEVGNQESFPWGFITANYDEKSGSSAIAIRYKT